MKKQFIILLPFVSLVSLLVTACGSGSGGSNTPKQPQLSTLPNNGYYIGSANSTKTPLRSMAYGTITAGQVEISVINQQGVSFIYGVIHLNSNDCFEGIQAFETGGQRFTLSNCTYVNNSLIGHYKNASDDEGTINITLNTTQLPTLPTPNNNYKGSAVSNLTSFISPVTGNIEADGKAKFTYTNNNTTIEGKFQLGNTICFDGDVYTDGSPFPRKFQLISCSYQAGGAITGTYTNEFGDAGTFTISTQ
jgi:hypothetical protein